MQEPDKPQRRPYAEAIGQTVAALREQQNLTQTELARIVRHTGVAWTGSTVAKVETGRRDLTAGEIVALGLALGTPPAELLDPHEDVRLGRTERWVPRDAVTIWAAGHKPDPRDRARWEKSAVDGAASLADVIPESRALVEYQRAGKSPDTAVAYMWLQRWEASEAAAGREVTPRRRRAKHAQLVRSAAKSLPPEVRAYIQGSSSPGLETK